MFGCGLATHVHYISNRSASVVVEECWQICAWHIGVYSYGEYLGTFKSCFGLIVFVEALTLIFDKAVRLPYGGISLN